MKYGQTRITFIQLFILTAIMVLLISCGKHPLPALTTEKYWPTDAWQISSPEEQDMDADRLEDLLGAIEEQNLNLDGLVVVRNGYIVLEAYYPPYEQDTLHEMYSITKGVISALVGIAIEEDYITGVNDLVLDYFPGQSFANNDALKKSITLKHLLTMSSGLEWDFEEMVSSRDWVQYTLDQPMYIEPGKEFFYNSGNAQVLSAIIQDVSGMDTRDFAEQYLFTPLGIKQYRWQSDVNDIPKGGWGMAMTPRDMAKLGYLYLRQGEWDGQQVIPVDWITASTKRYIQVQEPLEPWDLYLGYMWWLHEDGLYAAQGMKGQFVYVIPTLDLVVVITANIPDSEYHKPQILIRDFIIPAVAITTQE